jgi:hypothetical protein
MLLMDSDCDSFIVAHLTGSFSNQSHRGGVV